MPGKSRCATMVPGTRFLANKRDSNYIVRSRPSAWVANASRCSSASPRRRGSALVAEPDAELVRLGPQRSDRPLHLLRDLGDGRPGLGVRLQRLHVVLGIFAPHALLRLRLVCPCLLWVKPGQHQRGANRPRRRALRADLKGQPWNSKPLRGPVLLTSSGCEVAREVPQTEAKTTRPGGTVRLFIRYTPSPSEQRAGSKFAAANLPMCLRQGRRCCRPRGSHLRGAGEEATPLSPWGPGF